MLELFRDSSCSLSLEKLWLGCYVRYATQALKARTDGDKLHGPGLLQTVLDHSFMEGSDCGDSGG